MERPAAVWLDSWPVPLQNLGKDRTTTIVLNSAYFMLDINNNYLTNEYSFLSSVFDITLKVSIFLRSIEIVILSLPSV